MVAHFYREWNRVAEVIGALSDEIIWLMVIYLGLIFGSFATAVAWRVPRGKQFVTGRSHCPSCGHALGALDLLPVLSWVMLRGKCRYCKTYFGWWYPAAEMVLTLFFCLIYNAVGIGGEAAILAFASLCVVVAIVIDCEHRTIPNSVLLCVVGSLLSWRLIFEGGSAEIWFGLSLGLVLFFTSSRDLVIKKGLSCVSDVKVCGICVAVLSIEEISTFLFAVGVIGIITGLIWKQKRLKVTMPWGAIALASLVLALVLPAGGNAIIALVE